MHTPTHLTHSPGEWAVAAVIRCADKETRLQRMKSVAKAGHKALETDLNPCVCEADG